MRYKNNWPEARERLTALWERRRMDRPCLAVTAPSGKDAVGPPPPQTPEQRWLDPQWLVADALAHIENTWWGGESIPSYLALAGWGVCLGARPKFDDHTIWFETVPVDFSRPPSFSFDPQDPWFRRYEAVYMALAKAAGQDEFLVGLPCLLPANDLLSMLLGTELFLTSLLDHPEWMRSALAQAARATAAGRKYLRERLAAKHDFWYGIAGWMTLWAPEPYLAMQSDVSCMLSPEMFDEFILPELELSGREFGALWYHLDGGNARQHLPRLLSLPYLRVLQYTPAPCEPPNGVEHLEFYRKIQAAGKIVHIQAPKAQVLALAKALDPSLLCIDTSCSSPREGEDLLAAAKSQA